LLIGHEIQAQLSRSPSDREQPAKVHVIANERLAAIYVRALAAFGVEAQAHPENLAAAGMFALSQIPT
jgi:2-dehydro-3-deoxygalactonokinase